MGGNFKIRALKDYARFFTNGEVYEFRNGICTWDYGYKSRLYESFEQFIEKNSMFWKGCFELIKEEGENKMEDLRELLKQGYVVVHIDDTLSKVEMNSEGKLVISGDDHWCLVDKLTKELYGYNGSPKVAIKEIYEYSYYNSHAHKVSLDGRELIWKRTEFSPTQLKLEELEKKQREIADEMEKLRKEL